MAPKLISTVSKDSVLAKIIKDNTVKLDCIDILLFKIVQKYLTKSNTEFHTIPQSEEKTFKIVIKGYFTDTTDKTVAEELHSLGYETMLVRQFGNSTKKRLELLNFTQENNIDILLLNETHFKNHQPFKLPNFISHYINRPTPPGHASFGGTAILINRRLSHNPVHIQTTNIENTAIEIKTPNTSLRIVAVYKRPILPMLNSDLETLIDSSPNIIIAGDLNAKHHSWYSTNTNQAGRILFDYINSRNDTAVFSPSFLTHYPNNLHHAPDVLDVAILKNFIPRHSIENFPTDLSSDHTPIIMELFIKAAQLSLPAPSHIVNWQSFQSSMKETTFHHNPGTSQDSIDKAIQELTSVFSTNQEHYPLHQINSKRLPTAIQQRIRLKRHHQGLWQR